MGSIRPLDGRAHEAGHAPIQGRWPARYWLAQHASRAPLYRYEVSKMLGFSSDSKYCQRAVLE
jgi:hypothetical protein